MLKFLENLELAGITFIRDYIQFIFDDAGLDTYTLPQIRVENKIITHVQYGYCDTLCLLIDKCILSAYENKKENKIVIQFENNMELTISLNLEDRQCAEAAMLRIGQEGKCEVW